MREVVPTHSALMELREERGGMQEGYRFLDEKRLVLAAEIVRALQRYEVTRHRFDRLFEQASQALKSAVMRHGLEGLQVYPVAEPWTGKLSVTRRSVLGVEVQEARGENNAASTPPGDYASPEADLCRGAFVALLPVVTELAALSGNLHRLREDYRHTARRARALEDVLIPEIDDRLAGLELALEDLDREEAVRVRHQQRKRTF